MKIQNVNVGIKLLWLALVTSQKYLTMLINVPCEAEKVSSYIIHILSMSIGINHILLLVWQQLWAIGFSQKYSLDSTQSLPSTNHSNPY